MIQVQIASTLEAHGVADVRWVLIDPSETPQDAAAAGHALPAAGPALPMEAATRDTGLRVAGIVLLVAVLAVVTWLAAGPAARP